MDVCIIVGVSYRTIIHGETNLADSSLSRRWLIHKAPPTILSGGKKDLKWEKRNDEGEERGIWRQPKSVSLQGAPELATTGTPGRILGIIWRIHVPPSRDHSSTSLMMMVFVRRRLLDDRASCQQRRVDDRRRCIIGSASPSLVGSPPPLAPTIIVAMTIMAAAARRGRRPRDLRSDG